MESSPSIPFKSKKIVRSTPKKPLPSDRDPMAVVTPQKTLDPTPRVRNRNVALSLKDVRRITKSLLNSDPVVTTGSSGGSDSVVLADDSVKKGERMGKSVEKLTTLPEKYEMLCEFFDVMVNSIRLLRLKRLPSTFPNIVEKIESLTDRRFTTIHLAQFKYLLPEVVAVKKIRVKDEKTCCMKDELHVTLDMDAVEVGGSEKDVAALYSRVKQMFRSHITDYSKSHTEGSDIPEGSLPALFYAPKQDLHPNLDKPPTILAASHVSRSFQRRFSGQTSTRKLESLHLPEPTSNELGPLETKDSSSTKASDLLATPAKDAPSVGGAGIQGTPSKLASTPPSLIAATPVLRPPKRSLMSPDDDTDASYVPKKLVRRPQPSRFLNFDAVDALGDQLKGSSSDNEDKDSMSEGEPSDVEILSSAGKDVLDVLPQSVLQSVREKERKMIEEQDPAISQAKRRKQLMASVPKLFDMIRLLFQSIRRTVISKDELIYKLITGHLDIIDRREVEEQLQLLLEVAPEYISQQLCLSGHTLLRLNKSSNAESIRAKLLEAQ